VIELAVIGLAAGVLSGLLGVGGGVLFVPGLVFVAGLTQVTAEATSLLAIIPVALLGAWRQRSYGNLRLADGVTIGLLSVVGALGGVAVANILSGRALRVLFVLLVLSAAGQLVRGARRRGGSAGPPGGGDRLSSGGGGP
jgi:hypothetical protein